MENTNLKNLKELLEHYKPKTFGFVTVEERISITSILQLEEMGVRDLRNLRDFVVLFFARENGDRQERMNMDRMSAITAVIDEEIIKKEARYNGQDSDTSFEIFR